MWPMLRPDIFTGLRGPPKGLLLFGPPGTGKTLIGKCIACQSGATFFSISASSLTSKFVGEGEKLVRTLFAVARCHQPAVIFMDEIDSLLSKRTDSEHEASRRIKTEFLVQLDGAGTTGEADRLLVVGATNRPNEIDEAARRRLVKRLYIPLPDGAARARIVRRLLVDFSHNLTEAEFDEIRAWTKGYSGADMANLCKEASLGPIRAIKDIRNVSADAVRPISRQDFVDALVQVGGIPPLYGLACANRNPRVVRIMVACDIHPLAPLLAAARCRSARASAQMTSTFTSSSTTPLGAASPRRMMRPLHETIMPSKCSFRAALTTSCSAAWRC